MNADDMMEFLWEARNNFGKQMAAIDTVLRLGELELRSKCK